MSQEEALKSIHVYVDKDNKATICCPHCGYAATISAEKFLTAKKAIKSKCRCGQSFLCAFEFRKHYRKKVQLAGTLRNLKNRKVMDIIVRDVSGGGIGFTVMGQSMPEIGDVLDLTFTLDNANRSQISTQVTVMAVRDRFVGSQFNAQQMHKELGFYLMK